MAKVRTKFVCDSSQNISERYYSTLYRKLLDPALKASSKQAAFLNLLFKSIKRDESERRIQVWDSTLIVLLDVYAISASTQIFGLSCN